MTNSQSRAKFLRKHPRARAWAALKKATAQQKLMTPRAITPKKNQFRKKRAIVIGSGVGGLTTAYELLVHKSGMKVTVLEARDRTGGRCMSLRTGDSFTEDENNKLHGSSPGETQVVRFRRPLGDAEPYLNAGPGRIPSSHKRLLSYLRHFGVDVEVYVMNSGSNLVQLKDAFDSEPVVYRRIEHNTRGWLAELVFKNAETLIASSEIEPPKGDKYNEELARRAEQLQDLMVSFGELTESGKYAPTAGKDGLENGRTRSGFDVLPGVEAGEIADPLKFEELLDSDYWDKTRFFQPSDFLWQPTLFQPVGGMDRVQHAFAQKVAEHGGTIHLNSPVTRIDWDETKREYVISCSKIGSEEVTTHRADYVFCNLAMPFLKQILSETLLSDQADVGLEEDFKSSLRAVFKAQFDPPPAEEGSCDDPGYAPRFLADTTKVGWQAERRLWQGSRIEAAFHDHLDEKVLAVPDSEVGVVPIHGGISWTDHDIVQIWYPSCDYHGKYGVLTGAYNFSCTAYKWGKEKPKKRLKLAREGAGLFGEKFAKGLSSGVAIAWQNMPHIKGGWAQWHVVERPVHHFNILTQGSCVYESGKMTDPTFFVVGDQLSSLPGWQEGAIASALNAVSRVTRPTVKIPHLMVLPDTRLMVEGV